MPCSAYRTVARRLRPRVSTHENLPVNSFIYRSPGVISQQKQLHASAYPQLQRPCVPYGRLEQACHRNTTIANPDELYLPFDRLGTAAQHLENGSPVIGKNHPVELYGDILLPEYSKSKTAVERRVYGNTGTNGSSVSSTEDFNAETGLVGVAQSGTSSTTSPESQLRSATSAHPSYSESKLSTYGINSACSPSLSAQGNVFRKHESGPTVTRARSRPSASKCHERKPRAIKREAWQIQKDAISSKFGSAGWSPRKRLSPDALEGIRALHAQFPDKYTTAVLANQFEVSAEAVRRILKSKWRPSDEEATSRRQRWDKRGERIWGQMVALGVKPPKKWRKVSYSSPFLHKL